MQTATQPQQSSLSKDELWKLWYDDNCRKANIHPAELCGATCCVCCGSMVIQGGKYAGYPLTGNGGLNGPYIKMHETGKGGVQLSIGHTFEELKTLWPGVPDNWEHYEIVVDDKTYTITWKDS